MSDATAAPDLQVEAEPAEAEVLPADEAPQEIEAEAPLDAEASEAADQDGATPETVPAEIPEAETQPEIEERPFVLRADHQEIPVPGAVERGDEIVFPKAAWQSVQRHIVANRRQLIQQAQQQGRQQAEQGMDSHPTVVRSKALVEKFDELLGDQNKLIEWLSDFERNREILRRDLEIKELRARDTQTRTAQEAQQREQQIQQIVPRVQQSIGDYVDQILREPQFAGLDADVLKERARTVWQSLVMRADDDYPDAGIRRGELAVRVDLLRKMAEADLRLVEKVRPKPNPKATAAAKQNAAALGPQKKAPATVAAKGSPAPADDGGYYTGSDPEEFAAHMAKKYKTRW